MIDPVSIGLMGASFLGGLFGGGPKQQTSTTTTRRDLTPEQQQALSSLGSFGQRTLNPTDPFAGLAPIRDMNTSLVNKRFGKMKAGLADSFAARGLRGSGQLPALFAQLENDRVGELSNVDADIAQKSIEQQRFAASLLNQLIAQNFGQTETTKGTVSGNRLASAFGGAAGTGAYLYASQNGGGNTRTPPGYVFGGG